MLTNFKFIGNFTDCEVKKIKTFIYNNVMVDIDKAEELISNFTRNRAFSIVVDLSVESATFSCYKNR